MKKNTSQGLLMVLVGITMVLMPQPANALKINVLGRQNFTAAQSQKLDQSIMILNQVLNSHLFKEKVLGFTYQGQSQFVQNNGLSNQQIYDLLMEGAEKFPTATEPNEFADMYISIYSPPWYKRFSSAVAFTSSSDKYLHLYKNYYGGASMPDLSETIVHEWTHKMGFDHDFNSTARRPYTVPYGIGQIVNEVVVEYLK